MINQIISHYKILEKLGAGGMGIIYKAEDLKLKRTVALKVLPESFSHDEESKQRFIFEAQNASSLQHNNICTIHEIDETKDGRLFIVMDYYEGETLKNKICRKSLSIEEVIGITAQIAEGLNKAHNSGIIHRDIKPSNIFITKEGTIKILDFGLAKKIDRTQFTRLNVKFGTTDYMSPEQIKAEKVDHRTDIWSLGTVIYEMLTGQPPFKADYEQAIIYLILNQEPEDAKTFRDDIPEKMLTFLEKCMAKSREERYDDMECLIADLNNLTTVQDEPFHLPAPKPSNSIAVLPFVNINKDPLQEYFCDGLTEELINALSKIQDLKVVARTSVYAFKGGSYDIRKVGRKLDVKTILEGSVQRSGDKLRITVQLINVMDGYHIWSERYDRAVKDIFDIQDDIVLSVVNSLKLKLPGEKKENHLKRYTDNMEAYNLYQQASYGFLEIDITQFDKTSVLFNEVLKLDPNYAPAYYGLGSILFAKAYFGLKRTSEVITEYRKCVYKIIEIDDKLAEGYDLLGILKAVFEWNKPEGKEAWEHALELNPENAHAMMNDSIFFVTMKQFDTARILAARSKIFDPHSDYSEICNVFPDFYTAQYGKALDSLSKYLNMTPPFLWGLVYLWRTFSLMNRKEEAVQAIKRFYFLLGMNDVVQAIDNAGVDNAFFSVASILSEIYNYHYISPYDIALFFSHAGEPEKALNWIGKAIEERDLKIIFLDVEPEWQVFHEDPRFKEYLKIAGYGNEH